MRKLTALLMLLCLLAAAMPAMGETGAEDMPEWTSSLPAIAPSDMDFLILADSTEPLPGDYVPAGLQPARRRQNDNDGRNLNGGVAFAKSGKIEMVQQALNALGNMMEAAENEGVNLYLRAGYRSYADQEKVFKRANGDATYQKAGESDYQTGLACDVVGKGMGGVRLTADFGNTAEGTWMAENAMRFGFIIRYPEGKEDITGNEYAPWHLRYVGSSKVAGYIMRQGMALEEFVADYREALAAYEAIGGSVEILLNAQKLPEGPVITTTAGPDGDLDIILFHD